MQVTIQPSKIKGLITAPTSKSAMQRACAAALVKGGETILHNPGHSADDKAALDIIQNLGAIINPVNDTIVITSNGVDVVSGTLNCGESGLSVRMFTSIAALSDKPLTIKGSGSLLKRPLSFFNEVFPQLSVAIKSENGHLPLQINGPLQPRDITVDGSLSSQYLTGLLFAYSAADASDVTITVKHLNSRPYIDLTLKVMTDFGLKTPIHNNYETFYFPKQSTTPFPNKSIHYTVEGDWSGGAFLLAAGAISGNIIVKGLDVFSTQADKAILQALMRAGASLSIEEEQIEVWESKLKAFQFNATDCPDLFPPLVALAANCHGTSVIEGVHRLTHKESNRALTLQEEFGKMGIEIDLQEDLMIIKGGKIKGAVVHSHHDHRIAMACAVAALNASFEVIVQEAQAVNKSYPDFWKDLDHLTSS
ncbi:MAG TPA: 3-phosphoshikimate 1-carboxyvinyltransferase [Flavisolibacter sp.]|nr:3-phosphoshikimate 1-carboxyvinyltransferase [Flavisolibacter sp.]